VEFWKAYPHKVDKPAALKAWPSLNPDADLIVAILAGLERYKATKPEWQAWKHPGPWLNARKWEDEPAPEAPKGPVQRPQPTHGDYVMDTIAEALSEDDG